jgi:hypothetical protein
MIKLKAADYVLKHKAMDSLRFEKDVLLLALNGLIDDVYPILDVGRRNYVKNHVEDFMSCINSEAKHIANVFESVICFTDRKEFALAIKDNVYKQFLFKMHSGLVDVYPMLIEMCKRGCATQASTIELKKFLGFTNEYK